jgi:site-specific recombinase XerD
MEASAYDLAVSRFLAYLEDQRHVSKETLRAYVSDLDQFRASLAERFADRLPGPEAIDALAIRGFLSRLHHGGLAKASIARKLSAVRSF